MHSLPLVPVLSQSSWKLARSINRVPFIRYGALPSWKEENVQGRIFIDARSPSIENFQAILNQPQRNVACSLIDFDGAHRSPYNGESTKKNEIGVLYDVNQPGVEILKGIRDWDEEKKHPAYGTPPHNKICYKIDRGEAALPLIFSTDAWTTVEQNDQSRTRVWIKAQADESRRDGLHQVFVPPAKHGYTNHNEIRADLPSIRQAKYIYLYTNDISALPILAALRFREIADLSALPILGIYKKEQVELGLTTVIKKTRQMEDHYDRALRMALMQVTPAECAQKLFICYTHQKTAEQIASAIAQMYAPKNVSDQSAAKKKDCLEKELLLWKKILQLTECYPILLENLLSYFSEEAGYRAAILEQQANAAPSNLFIAPQDVQLKLQKDKQKYLKEFMQARFAVGGEWQIQQLEQWLHAPKAQEACYQKAIFEKLCEKTKPFLIACLQHFDLSVEQLRYLYEEKNNDKLATLFGAESVAFAKQHALSFEDLQARYIQAPQPRTPHISSDILFTLADRQGSIIGPARFATENKSSYRLPPAVSANQAGQRISL